MSKSASTNTQKNWSTSTNSLDDQTKDRLAGIWNSAMNAGTSGPSPLLTGAGQYGTGAQTAGALGLNALSGNPQAMQSLMNPYTSNVINANNDLWQKMNAQTANQVAGQATAANAFGGSRYGVALGTALAANNQSQAAQNAGLLSDAFTNAQGQANNLANFGFQGAGLNSNLGFGGVGNADQWLMNMLRSGYVGPTGSTTGTTTTQTGLNTEGKIKIPFIG